MTRLGDLLELGQLFIILSFWQQVLGSDLPPFLGNFCKGVKTYNFSSEIILGNFYRHLAMFSGHTGNILSQVTWVLGTGSKYNNIF